MNQQFCKWLYLDIFNTKNDTHASLIKTYPGDFLTHFWNGDPIEILFIDIAKTRELNSHLIKEFFPHLIPNHSIVIQQDYYHVWHSYIHVTMEYLKDYFEIVDPYVQHQSRVYRLIKPIPATELERVVQYDFSLSERLTLINRSAEVSPSPSKEMLEAIAMYEPVTEEAWAAYGAEMAAFEHRHPDFRSRSDLWAVQAKHVETYAKEKLRLATESRMASVGKTANF